MRVTICSAYLIAFLVAGASFCNGAAQQSGAPPTLPPLMECGVHGSIEILCGARSPEDLELTPDGKYLIATQFVNQGRPGSTGGGMSLFDIAKKTFSKMVQTAEPSPSWGDPACPGPIGDALVSHGSSLAKRKSGVWEVYVVNHELRTGGRIISRRNVEGNPPPRNAPSWPRHGFITFTKK
jgi:hypothetical protein